MSKTFGQLHDDISRKGEFVCANQLDIIYQHLSQMYKNFRDFWDFVNIENCPDLTQEPYGGLYGILTETFSDWSKLGHPKSIAAVTFNNNQFWNSPTGLEKNICNNICDCGEDKHNFGYHLSGCPANKGLKQ